VYGVKDAAAFDQLPDPRRQAFAAGDADGDATFISDATALRLVINRNQIELMCRAYADLDGRWLVNPMFINPLATSPPYHVRPRDSTSPMAARGRCRDPTAPLFPTSKTGCTPNACHPKNRGSTASEVARSSARGTSNNP